MAKGTPADFSLTLFPSAHANPDTLARRAAAEGLPLDFTAPQWTKPQTAKLRKVVLEQCRQHLLRAVHERSGSETNEWCAAQLENIKKLNDEELVALLQADSRPTNSSSSSSSSVRGGNGGGYVDDPTRPALVINWEEVAHHFGNRTASECRLQWAICQLPAASDAPWSKQENGRLVEVVRRHFGHDWVAIARELDTSRAPSACFIHYQRELNTSIVKKEWDASEDYLLRRAVAQFGKRNWQQVSNLLERRTGQQCLHRWQKTLDPNIHRGRWSLEEDIRLALAVSAFGLKKWHEVSEYIPGRTDVQIRERWVNVLDPMLKVVHWTKEEDQLLLEKVAEHGQGRWAVISKCLHPRTDNQCWRRWKFLSTTVDPSARAPSAAAAAAAAAPPLSDPAPVV